MTASHRRVVRDETSGTTRVVLLGMRCAFTQPTLAALVTAKDVDLAAVLVARNTTALSGDANDPMWDTIRASGAALIDVPDRAALSGEKIRTRLDKIAPDIIVVACFPWRLPEWLLSLPPGGCVNVHPSLLPDGRGPEPVFWAFRWGLTETGVTLHLMDQEFDNGPVISQHHIRIPEGATIKSLESTLAEVGAGMVIEHLSASSTDAAVAIPQSDTETRYARFPQPDDLVVPTSWTAHHAARFIHAVVPSYGPVPILVLSTGQRLAVDQVVQVDTNAHAGIPVVLKGDEARIQFADSVLVCAIVQKRQPILLRRGNS